MPWDEVVKDRGASFSSIRDIFLHVLDVEDRMINYIILNKSGQWVQHDYEKFIDVGSIEKRVNGVEKNVDAYLVSLTQHELDRKVRLPWRKDPPLILSVEDIIVQIAIEAASHMGELIAILWQVDKQPPFLGWSAFLEQGA